MKDKNVFWKWFCIITGGLFGLGATIFDNRHKDRQYAEKLDAEVKEHAKRLLGEKDD